MLGAGDPFAASIDTYGTVKGVSDAFGTVKISSKTREINDEEPDFNITMPSASQVFILSIIAFDHHNDVNDVQEMSAEICMLRGPKMLREAVCPSLEVALVPRSSIISLLCILYTELEHRRQPTRQTRPQ